MKIVRRSMLTGKTTEREIAVTPEQLAKWEGGMLIQDAMPNVPAEDREFIMSGITPEEWNAAFKEDQDEAEARDHLGDIDVSGRGQDQYGSLG